MKKGGSSPFFFTFIFTLAMMRMKKTPQGGDIRAKLRKVEREVQPPGGAFHMSRRLNTANWIRLVQKG